MLREEDFREIRGSDEPSLQEQNITGRNEGDPNANTPLRVLTASSILGDDVINTKGENIGSIKNLMVNVRSGTIEYVVLSFGGFLGIGEKLFAIPYKSLYLDEVKEVFILDVKKEFLERAPGFDKDHWPETNSRHWGDVTTYWGTYTNPMFPYRV